MRRVAFLGVGVSPPPPTLGQGTRPTRPHLPADAGLASASAS